MNLPKVNRVEAANFAKSWNHNGVAIPLTDVHIDFATDFANIVLRSFVQLCAVQAKAAFEAAQKQQANIKPEGKIIIGE